MIAIRWNYAGAFLGSVAKSDIADAPEKDVEDDRSLLFPDFLGTPLLSTNGLYTERKFSGTDQAGDNVDNIGRAIDCFAHHVLIDSKGTFLLTDLQGQLQLFSFIPPDPSNLMSCTIARLSGTRQGGHSI